MSADAVGREGERSSRRWSPDMPTHCRPRSSQGSTGWRTRRHRAATRCPARARCAMPRRRPERRAASSRGVFTIMKMADVLGAVFAVTLAACTATSDEVADAEETGADEGALGVSDVAAAPATSDHESRFTSRGPAPCAGASPAYAARRAYIATSPPRRTAARTTGAARARSCPTRARRTSIRCAAAMAARTATAASRPRPASR